MSTATECDNFYLWMRKALDKLDDDFRKCRFNPSNEQDFHTHLYHCLMLTKDEMGESSQKLGIRNEFKIPASGTKSKQPKSIDMVLTYNKEPRLCVELKESSGEYRSTSRMERRLKKNIANLMNNRDTLTHIGVICKPLILYWFWGIRQGILPIVNAEIKPLIAKYPEILFWVGPLSQPRK